MLEFRLRISAINLNKLAFLDEFRVELSKADRPGRCRSIQEDKKYARSHQPRVYSKVYKARRRRAWSVITETCASDQPHLITAVATTAATVADVSMGSLIQDYLQEQDLKPSEHLVDGGYVLDRTARLEQNGTYRACSLTGPVRISAEYLLHSSENMDIEVLGPLCPRQTGNPSSRED